MLFTSNKISNFIQWQDFKKHFFANQQNKTSSVTKPFIKMLNKPNYILNISVNMQNIEELAVNNKNVPDGMNGEIDRYSKIISIFNQYETNNLYWYQAF